MTDPRMTEAVVSENEDCGTELHYERYAATTPHTTGVPGGFANPAKQKRRKSHDNQPVPEQPRAARRRLYSMPEGLIDIESASLSQKSSIEPPTVGLPQRPANKPSGRGESVYDLLHQRRAKTSQIPSTSVGPRGGSRFRRGGRKSSVGRGKKRSAAAVNIGSSSPPVTADPESRALSAEPPARRPRRAAAAAACKKLVDRSYSSDRSSDSKSTPENSNTSPNKHSSHGGVASAIEIVCRNASSSAEGDNTVSNGASVTAPGADTDRHCETDGPQGRDVVSPVKSTGDAEHHSPIEYAFNVMYSDDDSPEASPRHNMTASSDSRPEPCTPPPKAGKRKEKATKSTGGTLCSDTSSFGGRRNVKSSRDFGDPARRDYSVGGRGRSRRGRVGTRQRGRGRKRATQSPDLRRSHLTLPVFDDGDGSPIRSHSYRRSAQTANRQKNNSPKPREPKRRYRLAPGSPPPPSVGGSSLESLVVERDPYSYRYGPRVSDSPRMLLGPNLSQNTAAELERYNRSRSYSKEEYREQHSQKQKHSCQQKKRAHPNQTKKIANARGRSPELYIADASSNKRKLRMAVSDSSSESDNERRQPRSPDGSATTGELGTAPEQGLTRKGNKVSEETACRQMRSRQDSQAGSRYATPITSTHDPRLSSSYRAAAAAAGPSTQYEWGAAAGSEANLMDYSGYPPVEVARAGDNAASSSQTSESPGIVKDGKQNVNDGPDASQKYVTRGEPLCVSLPSSGEFPLEQPQLHATGIDPPEVVNAPLLSCEERCSQDEQGECEPPPELLASIRMPEPLPSTPPSTIVRSSEVAEQLETITSSERLRAKADLSIAKRIGEPYDADLTLLCERLESAPDGDVITRELRRLVHHWLELRRLEQRILQTMRAVRERQLADARSAKEAFLTALSLGNRVWPRLLSACDQLERLALSENC